MWCVVINNAVEINVFVVTLFKSDYSREAVAASESVADCVGAVTASKDHVVVDDVAEVTSEGYEVRLIETEAQAAELDVCVTKIARRTVGAVVPVVTSFSKSLEGTEFGFRSSRETKRETCLLSVGVTILATEGDRITINTAADATATSVNVIATSNVVTNIARYAQAGFGAWDVEVASAVSIANADIFNCFWLWCDDCVGSLSAGSCNQSCSGAEEKALDVHF